jgi:hypothetical protein
MNHKKVLQAQTLEATFQNTEYLKMEYVQKKYKI